LENTVSGTLSWIDKLIGRDENHSPDDPCGQGMGDCNDVLDNGSDFIDGEAPSNLTARIRHHLGFCDDCDGWMTSLAQTVGFVRQAPQHEVPESLKKSIGKIADE
jgi:hypothetical protein